MDRRGCVIAFDVGTLRALLVLDDAQFDAAIKQVPGKAKAAGNATERAMDDASKSTDKLGASSQKAAAQTEQVGV